MTLIIDGVDSAAERGTARRRHPASRQTTAPVGRRSGPFILLGVTVIFLLLLGLLMVLSASSVSLLGEGQSAWRIFFKQMIWLIIGTACLIAAMRFDYHHLRRLAFPGLWASVALLVAVQLPGIGIEVNGSSRWIGFGEVTFQPSELAKLCLILVAADLFTRPGRSLHDERATLRPVVVLYLTVACLLYLQPDLGTILITGMIVGGTVFASGIRIRTLCGYGLVGGVIAGFLATSAGYRRDRLFAARDPWEDQLDSGYQILQGLTAVANGGATGLGLGAGRGKWGYLPFAHSDFIYAVIAEELGFLGACAILAMFLLIGVLAFAAAVRAPDLFGRMIAAGIGTWILVQAFVNVGGVLNVIPVTGVPLPFVSYGGSSLIVLMAAMGILLNIARQGRPRVRSERGLTNA